MTTYGSVCSGIEAASVAWEPLGFKPAWFAEIEPFPSAVLAHRWPQVPNLGDMTALPERILSSEVPAPDVLVGGTPCQAFSVAGMRGGLSDARGNLTLVLVRILDAIDTVRRRDGRQPCTLVWENVPGVLSSKDNAFGCFLGAISGEDAPLEPTGKRWTNAGVVSGHKREIAWRVLDAQFFGVPQRRRRVFLVASTGGGQRPEKILFERESVSGDFEPGGASKPDIAACAARGSHWDSPANPHPCLNQSHNTGGIGASNQELFSQRGGGLVPVRMRGFGDYALDNCASTLKARDYKDASDLIVVHGRQDPCVSDTAFALDCQHSGNTNVICIYGNIIGRNPKNGGNGLGVYETDTPPTLTATDRHAVSTGIGVRRLMPVECERLQGFPDSHTQIAWRGKSAADCPDGERYKAIGNSMAVPCMRWIGKRLLERLEP